MNNLEHSIRQANPVVLDPRRPLDSRAEADLARILALSPAASGAMAAGHVPSLESLPRARRNPWVLGLAAAAAVGIVVAGLTGVGALTNAAPATAAVPEVLQVTEAAVDKNRQIAELMAASEGRQEDPDFAPGMLTFQHWELGTMWDPTTESYNPEVSLPVTVELDRKADDSGARTVTVGQPFSAVEGDVEFTGQGVDVEPGTVVKREFSAGEWDDPRRFPVAPPEKASELKAYLQEFQAKATAIVNEGPQGMMQSLGFLITDWNLTEAQNRAILGLLGETPEVKALGTTTDRLGREGVVFGVDTEMNGLYRTMVVVDPETGEILAYEEDYLAAPADEGTADFPAPSVIRYTAISR